MPKGFYASLRKDAKNPFRIRDDEPGDEKEGAGEDGDGDKESDEEKGAGGGKRRGKHKEKAKVPMKIEFEGIERRAIRVPLEADNLSNLEIGDESLLYQRSGPSYYGRESGVKAAVMAYSINDRQAKPMADHVPPLPPPTPPNPAPTHP